MLDRIVDPTPPSNDDRRDRARDESSGRGADAENRRLHGDEVARSDEDQLDIHFAADGTDEPHVDMTLGEFNDEEMTVSHELHEIAELGPTAEAAQRFGEFLAKYWERDDGQIPVLVATASMYQGFALEETGRPGEAAEVFTRVWERFGDSDETDLVLVCIAATLQRGLLLGGATGIAAAAELVMQRYAGLTSPQVRLQLATARHQQALLYHRSEMHDELVELIEQVANEFADDDDATIDAVVQAVRALPDTSVDGSPSGTTGASTQQVSGSAEYRALAAEMVRARDLANAGDHDQALTALSQVIESAPDGRPEQALVAYAYLLRASIIGLDDRSAATVALEALFERFGDATAVEVVPHVAAGRINYGVLLAQTGAVDRAVRWFADTAEWLVGLNDDTFDIQRAVALFHAGSVAMDADRDSLALDRFSVLIDQLATSDHGEVQAVVARAMLNSASLLVDTGQPAMALAALDLLLERYGDDASSPDLQETVTSARAFRAELVAVPPDRAPGADDT